MSPPRRQATIRRRLLAIVLVPSVSLLSIALIVAAYLAHQGDQARRAQSEVRDASRPAARVVAALQEERRLSIEVVGGHLGEGQRQQLAKVRAQAQQAWVELVEGLKSSSLSRNTAEDSPLKLQSADKGLQALPVLRQGIDGGRLNVPATYSAYNQLIDAFGGSLRELARSAPDANAAYEQMTAVDLFQAAEQLSRSVALASVPLQGDGTMAPALFAEYSTQVGAYHGALATLTPRLPAAERTALTNLMRTNAWQQQTRVEGILLRVGSETQTRKGPETWPPLGHQDWEKATKQINAGLTAVYAQHSATAAAEAESTVQDSLSRALIIGLILLVVGLGVVWVAFRLSNELVRRLRSLRNDTLTLSEMQLPAVVERLRRGEDFDVSEAVPALHHGDDEIGEVATAFNHAQQMAVEAAAQEATTRAGTKAVFLNIARRSQVIAYRQLRILDQAERRQEDPEQLNLLFQLDHLATRARRNAENLVILSGEQPGRRWRQPVTLVEVVRGAIAETEQYTRVSIGLTPECSIEGTAVADLIHILAELVDNATAFAPPSGRVDIRGNVVGRGVVLEIEDQGLGIAPSHRDELNAMLREVPEFSVMALSAEPRLGLFVVARLAARHGVQVTLQESHAYGGTKVVVLVPAGIIADSAALGDLGMLPPAAGTPAVTGSIDVERLAIPQEAPVTVPAQKSSSYSEGSYGREPAQSGSTATSTVAAAAPAEEEEVVELTAYELMFQPRKPEPNSSATGAMPVAEPERPAYSEPSSRSQSFEPAGSYETPSYEQPASYEPVTSFEPATPYEPVSSYEPVTSYESTPYQTGSYDKTSYEPAYQPTASYESTTSYRSTSALDSPSWPATPEPARAEPVHQDPYRSGAYSSQAHSPATPVPPIPLSPNDSRSADPAVPALADSAADSSGGSSSGAEPLDRRGLRALNSPATAPTPVTPEPLPPTVVHSPVIRVPDEGPSDWPEPEPFGDKPPLPRRRRQTNLAPQLHPGGAAPMAEGSLTGPTQPAPQAPEQDDADRVRARFAAFQRGTQEGRSGESSSDSA
jgi:signal transduction histidine kinase